LKNLARKIKDKLLPKQALLSGAFAGDSVEKQGVDRIINILNIERIVETGTYIGKTSFYLAQKYPKLPVYSCEINPDFCSVARKNTQSCGNLIIENVSSNVFIARLTQSDNKSTFFFLDAHWGDYLPLLDELKSILNDKVLSFIIIDEFKVPNRPDLAFAINDGKGTSFSLPEQERMKIRNALELSLIEEQLSKDDLLMFPRYSYEDALEFGNPLHNNLIGYVIVVHSASSDQRKEILDDEFLKQYYYEFSLQ
jgi:hypothetical protein